MVLGLRHWLTRRRKPSFGDLAQTTPLSLEFGFDRGTPIDRYYIESFLASHASDIRGRTLEIGDDTYTARYGGSRAFKRDILHVRGGNPRATIVGDLSKTGTLPEKSFDSIVLTQTLHLIYDMPAAIAEVRSSLTEGGVLLVTSPGISQIARDEWGENWFWSVTPASAQRLFGEVFGSENIDVRFYGNVFAATAFLQGIAVEEVPRTKLDAIDPAYPLIVTVRATRRD
jgi:SAM-dependent methyltransferase